MEVLGPEPNVWTGLVYANGLFVAVASDGTIERAMSSPDGINWKLGQVPEANFWNCVTSGKGIFVAVSIDGTHRVMTTEWEGDGHPITEQYRTETGEELQPATFTWVDEGADYSKTAPNIDGYTCVGHRVDGGAQQSGTTAWIENVTAEHTVVFVYRKYDGGGTDPGDGDGKCCCCCKPYIHIPICTCNSKMIDEVCQVIQKHGCACDCD